MPHNALTRQTLRIALLCATLTGCQSKTPETGSKAQPAAPTPAVYHVDPATAGSVSGTVTYDGPVPKARVVDMSSDPACVAAHKGKAVDESLVVGRRGALTNAFVYISKGLEGKHFAVPAEPATIDQAGCWFRPRVLGVQVGQTLNVVNSDPVTHNIHPMATTNREWNHSQGPGDPPMHRTFTRPEIMIPVKCNIHDWMHAFIGVVDHPYFAVTGDDGGFALKNLPPGTYTVTAWSQTLGTQEAEVTVASGGKAETKLQFHAK